MFRLAPFMNPGVPRPGLPGPQMPGVQQPMPFGMPGGIPGQMPGKFPGMPFPGQPGMPPQPGFPPQPGIPPQGMPPATFNPQPFDGPGLGGLGGRRKSVVGLGLGRAKGAPTSSMY